MTTRRSLDVLGLSVGGVLGIAALGLLASPRVRADESPATVEARTEFRYPCEDYVKGVRKSNFGAHIDRKGSPFHDSWHLAEDVWVPAGREVRAIADGVVRYSAFSPTWTDDEGRTHWNLGNVIVIEHAIVPAEAATSQATADSTLCSFYVHLAADRRVVVGERVECGQVIGRIGADRSEENGRYPTHLHFGIHRGPYVQITPSLVRELNAAASSEDGLRFGDTVLRGTLELTRHGESNVLVRAVEGGETALLSLLVGSTAPTDPPPDIMGWCQGYGDERMVAEWLSPSAFLKARGAR